MRRALAVVATCLILSGCGTTEHTVLPTQGTPPRPHAATLEQAAAAALSAYPKGGGSDFDWGDEIFHFVDEHGDVVDAAPWTACLGNGCWDGAPELQKRLAEAGSPNALYFAFDYPGWTFDDVSFNPVDDSCHRRVITVKAVEVSDGLYRIDPAGAPGPWRVDVFGRGPEGDAVTSILWDTPAEGTRGDPASGVAAVLASHDGRLDSYGVELGLSRLDRSYRGATASITVASKSGRSVTITPHLGRHTCGYDGDLFFTAADDQGREATRLGEGPFSYTARVELGDTTYVGTGTYPDDLIKGNEPSIRLTWNPPLPSYAD